MNRAGVAIESGKHASYELRLKPSVLGFNPNGVSSSKDGFWEMDPHPVPSRMWGNWRKSVSRRLHSGMDSATEFICLSLGGVTVSGFVTPEDWRQIDSGAVTEVVIRQVTATHEDVGEPHAFGDLHVIFAGGEPTAFSSGSIFEP
ncbi:hypothetical protein E5E91_09455 [Deinococcus radiodurans R1 = ATCC 13939 = DSM 20539]|uniref:Uncharacterized protein n=2 Tax=Deinococcus radiodurans TaxID=1299 RepID=Q9RTD2_DEIRA|nr:hypothetical protein DR_1833 [Deinococcus radiodurans R1 = ATCC 13939 = DSM 20539]QEM71247.1 hypothetical protein DXG80_05370 [Deinococcus radiodurans]UDL00899.1 hypothetical protein E5E91_09455 [Deinococcus radiodurans R1 = ATCC 13939 = DSM 20539]HCE65514.1 hypothetical protein [Deinococcus radiodurans]